MNTVEITGILIPVDEYDAVHIVKFQQGDIRFMQSCVGGTFDVIDTTSPALSLWINDEGRILRLRPNMRATHLLWCVDSRWRSLNFLAGSVLVTGQPDEEGNTTSVPVEFVRLVFDVPDYRVEERLTDSDTWRATREVFTDFFSALDVAVEKAIGDPLVCDIRIVPAA